MKWNISDHSLVLKKHLIAYPLGVALLLSTTLAFGAHKTITFHDIAIEADSGIDYRRTESPRNALFDALKNKPTITMDDAVNTPIKARGAPGVAIFDYDQDGDLDLYVTNGPNSNNSLYANQLKESGRISFIDLATVAGVDALGQDSSGVCFGDIDNDGDQDLLVLGTGEPNRLFENQGDGSFTDISNASDIGNDSRFSSSCAIGDVNGDGLLDIVVANSTISWDSMLAIVAVPFALNEHNQLFLNSDNNVFVDVSETSGIKNLAGFPAENQGAASITWAIAMLDYDLDGDTDIIHGDDQGFIPSTVVGGVDRGLIHILQNDGDGHFSDKTVEVKTNVAGAWMGLSFGDINADGSLDIFASNVGDYYPTFPGPGYPLGAESSRWFLGQADGTFDDPGVGELVATPFGWGTSMFDYDNDGDTDTVFHGGLDQGLWVDASNPGVVFNNDGHGQFTYDANALSSSTNHSRRNVKGMAVGDLNDDGFVDIVSVSNFDTAETTALAPYSVNYGSPFDATALFVPTFIPTSTPGEFQWSGLTMPDGTLSVELNSASNRNKWAQVELMGTIDITNKGRVNRDGIGAVVSFKPNRGDAVMQPILGGSSHASQDALLASFGLGKATKGTIEVLWPGGVRNRLYNVRHSERIEFPEIPCSFDADWRTAGRYRRCVIKALTDLQDGGYISKREKYRFLRSAIKAYVDSRTSR